MMDNERHLLLPPNLCKDRHGDFVDLVVAGREMDKVSVRQGVCRAKLLCFFYSDEKLLGVAALKTPLKSYREGVCRKAGVPGKLDSSCLELGYVAVDEASRGRGMGRRMCEIIAASPNAQGQLFATTRVDNQAMETILVQLGFGKHGEPYESQRRPGRWYQLYVREAATCGC